MSVNIDPIFGDPRLVAIYDAFDGERNDLLPYLELASELNASDVIDLGCGTGIFARMLSAKGLHVTAVDPAQASIEYARSQQHTENIDWITGDASSLPITNTDAVFMTGNVVQAIEPDEWSTTLQRIHASLRPGGHIVFESRNPTARAWEEWNKERAFQRIALENIGEVDGWVELTSVALPLVSFTWTYFFHADGITLTSDSTLWFRSAEEITNDLVTHGFTVVDVREAPDRPGKEHVFIAQSR